MKSIEQDDKSNLLFNYFKRSCRYQLISQEIKHYNSVRHDIKFAQNQ